jgi:hypothetical protein
LQDCTAKHISRRSEPKKFDKRESTNGEHNATVLVWLGDEQPNLHPGVQSEVGCRCR